MEHSGLRSTKTPAWVLKIAAYCLTSDPAGPRDTYPEETREADRHPVGEELLHHGLGAPQHELGLHIATLFH